MNQPKLNFPWHGGRNPVPSPQASPEETVRLIQAGQESLREDFIRDSLPDIRRIVRRLTHSFAVEQSDEYSIALEMFNVAIDRFKPDSQVPFLSFASLIIRNRVYDWFNQQKTARQVLSFTDCETDDGTPLADRLADPASAQFCEDLETETSLARLECQLKAFGLGFNRMVEQFPKHRDSRLLCIRLARHLAGDAQLMAQTMKKHRLPVAELARRSTVPVKTIDKNRASIIFLALLLRSDLDLLKTYIAAFEKGESG